MNIVRIQGKLPQQLFQLALYCSLSRRGTTAVHAPDPWQLAVDTDKIRFATKDDLTAHGMAGALHALKRKLFGSKSTVVTDVKNAFNIDILNLTNTYFDGQWFNPRYFSDAQEQIQQLLNVPVVPDLEQASVLMQVHRTGGNICTADYFNWAVANVLSTYPDAHFHVLTTDPAWVEANITFQGRECTVETYRRNEEFALLSKMWSYQHHILGGTLTGWWAAWLCNYPDKIIIAPKPWSRNPAEANLVPIEWDSVPIT